MWNKLSFIAYLASLTTLLVMLFRFNPLGISGFTLSLSVFVLGLIGFIFSIFSNYFDPDKKQKKNKVQTLVFYIGMIVVFTGIMTHIMHWPFTVELFIGGLIIIASSFFVKSEQASPDDDLLDDQI